MISFAEWLENNETYQMLKYSDAGEVLFTGKKVVSVRALGEWALEKAKAWLDVIYAETPKRYRKDFEAFQELRKDINQFDEPSETFIANIYFEIAVACLGAKEVERRLGALD